MILNYFPVRNRIRPVLNWYVYIHSRNNYAPLMKKVGVGCQNGVRKTQLQIIAPEINIDLSWMYADEKKFQAMPEANGALFENFENQFYSLF